LEQHFVLAWHGMTSEYINTFCLGMTWHDIRIHKYTCQCHPWFTWDVCCVILFLQASNNSITSLPEDLARCSKLTKVDVEVLPGFIIYRSQWWFFSLLLDIFGAPVMYQYRIEKFWFVYYIFGPCQGNKLKVLSGNLMASWTMLTEFNACNYLQ
jgi:hypothetical protein